MKSCELVVQKKKSTKMLDLLKMQLQTTSKHSAKKKSTLGKEKDFRYRESNPGLLGESQLS